MLTVCHHLVEVTDKDIEWNTFESHLPMARLFAAPCSAYSDSIKLLYDAVAAGMRDYHACHVRNRRLAFIHAAVVTAGSLFNGQEAISARPCDSSYAFIMPLDEE